MVDIQIFGKAVDSTVLALIVAVIGVIIAFLNYRKKPVLKEETSQSVSDSTGVIQQNADKMNIGQQVLTTGNSAVNLINCTIIIQNLNPNDFDKESVVKQISECIARNVPEVTGALIKDRAFKLSGDKLKLLNVTREKVEQYEKSTGKTVKDAGIMRAQGYEAYYFGRLDSSFNLFSKALSIDEINNDITNKSVDLNNIGYIYQDKGKIKDALYYYQKALEIDEKLKDPIRKSIRLNNIGTVYDESGEFEKAIEYYKKALEIAEEQNDKISMITKLDNIGLAYKKLGEFNEALNYFKKDLVLLEESNDWIRQPEITKYIGDIYHDMGNIKNALEYYQKSFELFKKLKDTKSSEDIKKKIDVLRTHIKSQSL